MLEFKKFWWMIKKELLSLKRHPGRLVSIIAFPIIMILLFGYGMGGELTDLPIVVVSQSHGDLTDLTLDTIKTTETYKVVEVIDDLDEGKERVNSGEVKAAIILPSDYDDDSTQQKTATLYLDSSDQMASQILDSSTQAIFNRLSNMVGSQTSIENKDANITPSISHSLNNFKDDISLHINRIYGNIKYIDFLVPAILGMTVMMSCMMGMGAAIAGERETGELARLFMTPTSVSTVIGGKIAAKLLIELMRALILICMAVLLFNVSIKGGLLPTFIVLVVGALCFVGFGMMLSARTSTQEDYAQLVMPFSMPMMFISGVFYPIETMPWILQKFAYIFPLTYLNDAMRGIMLKGQTLGDVWIDLAVLLGFTLLFFIIGVKRFNRDV
ncbi:MAG: ABC transporter permease [Methanobrevibacter sp.]|uniref:ABC transporter permease n=1 Tax=Methanobrevibacter sp. TaxID=66852 RepID=UPI003F0867AC